MTTTSETSAPISRNFATAKYNAIGAQPKGMASTIRTTASSTHSGSVIEMHLSRALNPGNIGLGVVLTSLASFMVSFFWHFKCFIRFYTAIGYFKHETKFPLLLVAYFVQCIILNYAFAAAVSRTVRRFVVPAVGLYHFTVHVLGHAARSDYDYNENLVILLLLESTYCAVHFIVLGCVLTAVHSRAKLE